MNKALSTAIIALSIFLFSNVYSQNNCLNTWVKEYADTSGLLTNILGPASIDKNENVLMGFNFSGNIVSDTFSISVPLSMGQTWFGFFTYTNTGQTTAAFQSSTGQANLVDHVYDNLGNHLLLVNMITNQITVQGQVINASNGTVLLKVDKNGNLISHQVIASRSTVGPYIDIAKMIYGEDGSLYFLGRFRGTCQIFGNTYTTSGYDVFIAKTNPDGSLAWLTHGGIADITYRGTFALDKEKNIVVTYPFKGDSLTFGNTVITAKSPADQNGIALIKFDSSGKFVWGKTGGSQTSRTIYDLIVDPSDNIYVSGSMSASFIFGNDTLNQQGINNVYLIKTDKNGDLIFANTFKSTGVISPRTKLALMPDNNLVLSGYFNDSLFLYQDTLVTNLGRIPQKNNSFIAFIDSNGMLTHYEHFTSSNNLEIYNTVVIPNGELYLFGLYRDDANLGNFQLNQTRSSFIYRYCKQGLISKVNQVFKKNKLTVTLFPNPANDQLNIRWTEHGSVNIVIRDLSGRELQRATTIGSDFTLPLDRISAGIYLLEVQHQSGLNHMGKFIKN